jgi:hypothetical protein
MMVAFSEKPCETREEFDRKEFFTTLYEKTFPAVASFIKKRNGSLDEARDVFHDALIIFYEKKSAHNIHIDVNEQAYVFGIVKHLWAKQTKENQRILLSEVETEIAGTVENLDADAETKSITTYLKSAGEKCMNLLKAFYYDKKSMDAIQSSFSFSSVRSATVQKFKCLEKVRNLVKHKSLNYEDFIDKA